MPRGTPRPIVEDAARYPGLIVEGAARYPNPIVEETAKRSSRNDLRGFLPHHEPALPPPKPPPPLNPEPPDEVVLAWAAEAALTESENELAKLLAIEL